VLVADDSTATTVKYTAAQLRTVLFAGTAGGYTSSDPLNVGALAASTGTFSGAVSGTTGTFSGATSATNGTFSGTLAVTGLASLNGGAVVTGGLTSTAGLTVGANALITNTASGYMIVGANGGPLYLRSGTVGGVVYVQDSAGSATPVNIGGVSLTFPASAAAVNGYVLSSTTGGVLSWAAASGTLPITAAAQSAPSAPASNNATVYMANYAGSATPTRLKVRDDTNQPYFLAASPIHGYKSVNYVFPYTPNGASATTLQTEGMAMGTASFAGGVVNSASGYTVWPWRNAVVLTPVFGVSIAKITAGTGAFFGATYGNMQLRAIVGCPGAVASVDGCMVGMVRLAPAFGDVFVSALWKGVYFFRDVATNSGNWSVSFDNGVTRGANTNTTMAFTTLHTYEMMLSIAPGSSTMYWQVNDVTAGTTASGNVALTVATGVSNSVSFNMAVSDAASVAMNFMGVEIEYDMRVV